MALEHAGEAVAHLRRRRADRDRAGDVGGAVRILAARIDQIERVHLDRQVGLLARPGSGRSRRSGPAPEMVSKLRSRRSPLSSRNCCELVGGGQLVERRPSAPRSTASGGSGVERRAVARLRGAVAGDLGRVLDRLGQDRRDRASRRSSRRPSRAPRRSPRPRARDRRRRSCRRARRARGSKASRSWTRTPLPRCWRTSSPIFSERDEQVGGAVVMDEREGRARPACGRRPCRGR